MHDEQTVRPRLAAVLGRSLGLVVGDQLVLRRLLLPARGKWWCVRGGASEEEYMGYRPVLNIAPQGTQIGTAGQARQVRKRAIYTTHLGQYLAPYDTIVAQ